MVTFFQATYAVVTFVYISNISAVTGLIKDSETSIRFKFVTLSSMREGPINWFDLSLFQLSQLGQEVGGNLKDAQCNSFSRFFFNELVPSQHYALELTSDSRMLFNSKVPIEKSEKKWKLNLKVSWWTECQPFLLILKNKLLFDVVVAAIESCDRMSARAKRLTQTRWV